MPARLTRGTIENVEVSINDTTGTVSSLNSSSPHFDVEQDDGTAVVTNQAATVNGMLIHCLCNTTTWPDTEQHFNLFVKFTVGPETPRLGPFDIYMIDVGVLTEV